MRPVFSTNESAVRARASRAGLGIAKSRCRTLHSDNHGGFMLFDRYTNTVVDGDRFQLTLADIVERLKE